jgi:exodeoxyribonuclease V alpha subunit
VINSSKDIQEKLSGIVERVTYHNEQNGWSVIKVSPFQSPQKLVTVIIHQAKVFAGASMEFYGTWTQHPQHGEQFKANKVIEKKPATAAALEKYLGSGLIKGVGPVTATRIVKHFKESTLDIFENQIDLLMDVPGIAEKKLEDIKTSWVEHRSIRDVMIFLQGYGISTLFAVKIFKTYGDKAIETVKKNPYTLARDIYGIGFFSADKIALNMGFQRNGIPRVEAGIKHVLASSRDEGHCFLTLEQIQGQTKELLEIDEPEKINEILTDLLATNEIKKRTIEFQGQNRDCFYSKSLYFDEAFIAKKVKLLIQTKIAVDDNRINDWVTRYCQKENISLSVEQHQSVIGITSKSFSILTGGPGCGKTTSTKVLVKLLQAMQKKIILAAPTGRAAQRMSEVIGSESKTIHRLLEWAPQKNGFKKNENDPLNTDFLIIDECSMLDVNLAAALLKAVRDTTQVLFIGDPDQLPSVGAGNVLFDLLESKTVPKFRLTQVFRQAESSSIIQFAHKINKGEIPKIISPIGDPEVFKKKIDCIFLDAEEATQEQAKFIARTQAALKTTMNSGQSHILQVGEEFKGQVLKGNEHIEIDNLFIPQFTKEDLQRESILYIPEKFLHVNLEKLSQAKNEVEELKSVLKKIHPWSTLNHGMTALDTILRLYTKTIPDILGQGCEIQILSPQVRGTLGTINLNQQIQNTVNPSSPTKKQIAIGERIYREGDRVIQTRNNYDLGVFNGDIGIIKSIDLTDFTCQIYYQGHDQCFEYTKEDLSDLQLAYGITIHKSQGSEFQAVIIPVASQHFKMLFRNLIYTGLTRAKKLAIFVGSRKALAMAVQTIDQRVRQTALQALLDQ